MQKIVVTTLLALIGGFIGHQLKFPAGAMVGAMLFVGVANILGTKPQLPESFNIIAQIIIGGCWALVLQRRL